MILAERSEQQIRSPSDVRAHEGFGKVGIAPPHCTDDLPMLFECLLAPTRCRTGAETVDPQQMVEILTKKLRNALVAAAFGDADMKIERLAPALLQTLR